MNRSNFMIGTGACVVSAGLFLMSFSYRSLGGGIGDPGAMFVPRLILSLIFAVGCIAMVMAFFTKSDTGKQVDDRDADIVPGITLTAVIAAVATAFYLLAFQ